MPKVLVVHGAGMNMRGKTQLDLFGPLTLSDYDSRIREYAAELGIDAALFHSNVEGETINRFYEAHDGDIDAALINPALYGDGHPALTTAIKQVRFPTIEIHITNPASRSAVSQIAPACRGVIAGFGLFGYYLGMKAAIELVSSPDETGADLTRKRV